MLFTFKHIFIHNELLYHRLAYWHLLNWVFLFQSFIFQVKLSNSLQKEGKEKMHRENYAFNAYINCIYRDYTDQRAGRERLSGEWTLWIVRRRWSNDAFDPVLCVYQQRVSFVDALSGRGNSCNVIHAIRRNAFDSVILAMSEHCG